MNAIVELSKLEQLESEMLQREQVKCSVIHRFGPGLYIRELFVPANTTAIGHHQNFEHLNVFLKGKVQMFNEDGTSTILEAPMMFVGKPGRKVGYIIEDMIWQNIYATEETDVDTLEKIFISKSDAWESHNIIKNIELQVKKESDRNDYQKMLIDTGFSHETARSQSENTDDQIQIEANKFKVSPSPIEGIGIFATADILCGENIGSARIDGMRTQLGRYTNHAKQPNSEMRFLDNGDINLVAIENINGCSGGFNGDEITCDYRHSIKIIRDRSVLCQP